MGVKTTLRSTQWLLFPLSKSCFLIIAPFKVRVALIDESMDRALIKNEHAIYTKNNAIIYTKYTTFAYTKNYTIFYTKYATDKGSVYNNQIARDYHGDTIGKACTGTD